MGEVANSLICVCLPPKYNTLVRELWLWDFRGDLPQDYSERGKRLTHIKQLCTKPLITSGINTHLLMVG